MVCWIENSLYSRSGLVRVKPVLLLMDLYKPFLSTVLFPVLPPQLRQVSTAQEMIYFYGCFVVLPSCGKYAEPS
jgi:hypothetical protein